MVVPILVLQYGSDNGRSSMEELTETQVTVRGAGNPPWRLLAAATVFFCGRSPLDVHALSEATRCHCCSAVPTMMLQGMHNAGLSAAPERAVDGEKVQHLWTFHGGGSGGGGSGDD